MVAAVSDAVEHPAHYGGKDNQYEVIKVAEAWDFDKDAYLFNVLKYIARPGKGNYLEDLRKARFYLDRKIARLEAEQEKPNGESSFARGRLSWQLGGGGTGGGNGAGGGAGSVNGREKRLFPCIGCGNRICARGVAKCDSCLGSTGRILTDV